VVSKHYCTVCEYTTTAVHYLDGAWGKLRVDARRLNRAITAAATERRQQRGDDIM
jgi:hypothetical protein